MLRGSAAAFRLFPYFMTTLLACLVVLAGWAIVDVFLDSDETLVIEVVPLEGPGQVRVQVGGAVAGPGVYLLPEGSTYRDALAAAGGPLDGAAFDESQLDRVLPDGEIITVNATSDDTSAAEEPVNVNTASAAELEALPGIGPALAARIVAYREEHGPFASAADLAAVSGISERMAAELSSLIVTGSP